MFTELDMNDLPFPPESSTDVDYHLDDNDIAKLYKMSMHLIDDFMRKMPECVADPDYVDILLEEVTCLVHTQLCVNSMFYFFRVRDQHSFKEEIDDVITEAVDHYTKYVIPPRSYNESMILCDPDHTAIADKIRKVEQLDMGQPKQGTSEWHAVRNGLITASTAYKAFESQACQNQLIYEKCVAHNKAIAQNDDNTITNGGEKSGSLEWGTKYEPVSVELYESMYNTRIGEFGCIPHQTHTFMGASPDGINIDPSSPRFGRMLEIKNPISRVITGVPKKEYWVQMQLQMEVCDLDECDFLETKFVEYTGFDQFIADGEFDTSAKGEQKGVMMQFSDNNMNISYVYKPLCSVNMEDEFVLWHKNKIREMEDRGHMWVKSCYWRLESFSCVLVCRNREWFNGCISTWSNMWKTICAERANDYSHRAPSRRAASSSATRGAGADATCMINVIREDIDDSPM